MNFMAVSKNKYFRLNVLGEEFLTVFLTFHSSDLITKGDEEQKIHIFHSVSVKKANLIWKFRNREENRRKEENYFSYF